MTSYPLKIVTPDGLIFDGLVEEVVVRTTSGDMGVLAGHVNCVAPLGMGRAMIVADGQKRYAACIGGMISVVDGEVTLVPTTFEWADSIDLNRAQKAYDRAQNTISSKDSSDADIRMAEARLKRALIRKNVASDYRR